MASVKKYTMFCKVCRDSGKTEAEFTSHYPRESADLSAKIVCPTLLALVCKYCKERGHTPKYCPVLKAKQEKEDTGDHYQPHQYTHTIPVYGKSVKGKRVLIDSIELNVVPQKMKTGSKKSLLPPRIVTDEEVTKKDSLKFVPRQVSRVQKKTSENVIKNKNHFGVLDSSDDECDTLSFSVKKTPVQTKRDINASKSAMFWKQMKTTPVSDLKKEQTVPVVSVEGQLRQELEKQREEMAELRRQLSMAQSIVVKSDITQDTKSQTQTVTDKKVDDLLNKAGIYDSDDDSDDEPGWGDLCMEEYWE